MMATHDVVVKNGMVVTGEGIARVDVGIRGGQVVALEPDLDPGSARQVIDAANQYVLPGAVDVHTHPVYLDDLGGISVSAAHGGVTTMVHYGYVQPGEKVVQKLEWFRQQGLDKSVLDFALHGGLFDVKHQLEEVPAAFKMGVTSFKVFMAYAKLGWMTDDYWMTALLDVVAHEHGLIAVHAENGLATDYLEDKYLREGRAPEEAFAAMRPDLLEAEAMNRAMSIAHLMGAPIYFPHCSAEVDLEPLRKAKSRGWKVIGETCPQYLTLTEESTLRLGPLAKIGPPLRTPADSEALWRGLSDGTLETIGSDHAPKGKKITDDFFKAPFGSPQIETMMSLIYDGGVNTGRLSLPKMVQALSENPARFFGLYPRKGTLQPGSDADLVVFDPRRTQILSAATQHSHADYMLYEGRRLTGAPVLTMQRGEVIVENGKLLAKTGRAQFLATDTSVLYN
jgi:dihydropyrimidinase